MWPRHIALAAIALALAATTRVRAEPPNLNILDGEAGETELELTGFVSTHRPGDAPGFQFNSEVNHAFTDGFGLQLQLTGFAAGGALHANELSLQALAKVVDLPDGGSLGVSAEGVIDPSDGATGVGGLVYGVGQVAGWRAAFNLGGEATTSGEDAALVYAWSATRVLSDRWSFGFEGGGSSPLRGGEAAEHYAGPALGWRLGHAGGAPWLRLGWLVGLSRASPDMVVTGISASF